MERFQCFAFLLCGIFVSRALSLPYRNVSLDCESMLPNHSTEAQETASPYHISISTEEYEPGNEVKVAIKGTSEVGFKWFMLQARDIDENIPVGSFHVIDPSTQGRDCYNISNSALIHVGSEEKHNVTALWVSPDAKRVQFIATIFQDPETYWSDISSTVLFPKGFKETAKESETHDESRPANASSRSRKKSSGVVVRISCAQDAAGSSDCVKSVASGSPQSSFPSGQGVVVVPGGSQREKSDCIGGGTSTIYDQYGCRDGRSSSQQSSGSVWIPFQAGSSSQQSYGNRQVGAPQGPGSNQAGFPQGYRSSQAAPPSETDTKNQVGAQPEYGSSQAGQLNPSEEKNTVGAQSPASTQTDQTSQSEDQNQVGSQPASTNNQAGQLNPSEAKNQVGAQQTPPPNQGGMSLHSYGNIQGGSTPQQNYGGNQGGISSQQNYGNNKVVSSSHQGYGTNQGGYASSQSYGNRPVVSSSQQGYGTNQGGYASSPSYGNRPVVSSSQQGYGTNQGGYASSQIYGNRPGVQGSQTFGKGSQTSGSYSSNDCDQGDVSTYGVKVLSSANCGGSKAVAAQAAAPAVIRKTRSAKGAAGQKSASSLLVLFSVLSAFAVSLSSVSK